MAASQSAAYSAAVAFSLAHRPRRFSSTAIYSAKPTLLISCVTPSFPSKPTRRNNYLRKKILKTLKQPVIPKPSLTPIDSPPLEEVNESGTISEILESDERQSSEAENEEVQNVEELGTVGVSVPAGNGVVGVLDKKSIWKYGLWFIGAFVFQTVCAVWVFTSSDSGAQDEVLTGNAESSVSEVGGDGKDKSRLVRVVLKGNGNGRMGVGKSAAESVVYIDEVEMQRKVEEIRALAREARDKERLQKGGYESEDNEQENDATKYFKSGIEEEVDNRLIKLRNKLETARPSSSHPLKGSVRKDSVEKDEGNGTLLFQKKYKFRDSPVDLVKKPKGFTGLNGDDDSQSDVDSIRSDEGIHVEEESMDKDVSKMHESAKGSWRNVANERGMSKQGEGKGKGAPKPKVVNGTASEKNGRRPPFGAATSQKSNAKSQKSGKSNDLDMADASTNGDIGSKGKGFEDSKIAVESKNDTDHWWSNLPYVLVIIMRNGDDGEGGQGFYTLKNISNSEDKKSYMVAFEDQADASNFCYLLESFFEDLEGFSADVVPLTIKELKEVVTSRTMNVIVAKRGRLSLYAGQPLDQAEMALQDLIEQV